MIEQRTPEWYEMRRGKVTASCIHFVTAKEGRNGMAATRRKYMAKVVAERLSGNVIPDTYINAAMQRGIDLEPQAIAAYQFRTDKEVEPVAFVDHHTIDMTGCSPDGLTQVGMIEVKCPEIQTHIDYLLEDRVPPDYVPQMQFQMACTTRLWNDFVSFCPEMPERMRLFIKRLTRDDVHIKELEAATRSFQLEVDLKLSALAERFK